MHLRDNESEIISQLILPIAVVNTVSKDGVQVPTRCLLDQCAELSYVSEDFMQKINLWRKRSFSNSLSQRRHSAFVSKYPARWSQHPTNQVQGYGCYGKITFVTGSHRLERQQSKNGHQFNKPPQIPILLGSKIYSKLVVDGLEHGQEEARSTINLPASPQLMSAFRSFLKIKSLNFLTHWLPRMFTSSNIFIRSHSLF